MKSKNIILNMLKKSFKNFNNSFSLAQVGSSLENDNYNDIDIIFLVQDKVAGINFLLNSFSKYEIFINDDAIRICNLYNVDVSIAIYTYMQIDNIVSNFISGEKVVCEHRPWALGYWIAEGFINDIRKCEIIYDDNNKLNDIKRRLDKKLLYSNQKILSDCKLEMIIKKSLLTKHSEGALTYSSLKIDIVLAMIRSCYVLSGKMLNSFKNIDEIIRILPQKYQKIINKYLKDTDETCLSMIIQEINCSISRKKSLFLGTWQFDGTFNNLSDEEIINLMKYAKSKGITKFDTALVYGQGNVEKLLSKVIDDNDIVLTKIPAKIKPKFGESNQLENYYDESYINCCIQKSLYNLNREKIDIVLLHNWSEEWNDKSILLDWLIKLKEKNIVEKIGISLPNGYAAELPKNILKKIDVIEAPFNPENEWILKSLKTYKENNIEVILRSIFMQGKLLKENKDSYHNILVKTNFLNTSMVIGMTTKEQINMNIETIEKSLLK